MAELPEDPDDLPLRRVWPFLDAHGLGDAAQDIQVSRDKVGARGASPLRRGRVIHLLKQENLLETFIEKEWANRARERGQRNIQAYERIREKFLRGDYEEGADEAGHRVEDEDEARFAYEADLRDYLAKNLHLLETGLKLWPVEAGAKAVEYAVDARWHRIDILAQDGDGVPVVIELKVSKGHERAVGQALFYRARVKEIFKAKRARIIIVAQEISSELRAACGEVQDVTLFEYSLSMTLEHVE